ncbi:MAG: hypothetical protein KDE53_14095, partial [Caldilineaceae bacterium]|nr:hypothetical protein [Caldilineaceae bacterium]
IYLTIMSNYNNPFFHNFSRIPLLLLFSGLLWLSLCYDTGASALATDALSDHRATSQGMAFHQQQPAGGTIPNDAESCETERSRPSATVLSPEDNWEHILTSEDAAAHTFLLRGGIYQATDKLWLKAGNASSSTVLKPYNCEQVILRTSLRPSSHTVIAGMQIEATGIDDTKWVVRFDGKDRGRITDIVLRNNRILGGTEDAIRINDDALNILIQGNAIDGGEKGHDIFVTGTREGSQPDGIVITQNLLTKEYFATASEDMIQVRDVGSVKITSNTCTNGINMEQCIDIKSTTKPLWISHNLFDGDNLHRLGKGEDGAGGCMVIHESDGHAEQHVIVNNLFRHCKGTIIRFAPGTRDEISSALIRYNLFIQSANPQNETDISTMPIEIAADLQFTNNTMVYGLLKLGNGDQSRLPQNLLFQDNIFYQTAIEDHTNHDQPAYHCTHNLIYRASQSGFSAVPCTQTITDDPHFVDSTRDNYYLLPDSPALGSGTNGNDRGALPLHFPATRFNHTLYLPIISLPVAVQ